MSKEIWLGPVLGNNRQRLLARCAEYVSSGRTDRLLYIAASPPLLDLVTEKLLDGKDTRGLWGDFPVYLFRGFVRRVLASAIVSEARPLERARSGCESSLTAPPQTGRPAGDDPGLGLLTQAPNNNSPSLAPQIAIDREELPLRRSLISQMIKQLSAAGKLKAIRPLANRDGCVNTIASLIGEIQRAGKTPSEFQAVIEARAAEPGLQVSDLRSQGAPRSQLDFDREIALIYAAYTEALNRFELTDEDADQLRALQVLHGEIDALKLWSPWLEQVELLVLDGFFDFTPVQGEMLQRMIPVIPNVIVNLNYDPGNEEIFQPFQSTIEQLKSVADFEIKINKEVATVSNNLAPLRERLFNSSGSRDSSPTVREGSEPGKDAGEPQAEMPALLLECSDRDTEIRSIAKEIKRLVFQKDYAPSDIALVVRERAAYAETILRVFADESIPCNLERRIEAREISCLRAAAKLFHLFKEPSREHVINPKASDIAHLIKSDYFRVSEENLQVLIQAFEVQYKSLFERSESAAGAQYAASSEQDSPRHIERLRAEGGIGRWAPDILENVIAYVGSELRVKGWIDRAQRLIRVLPSPEAARSFIGSSDNNEGHAAAEEDPPPEASVKDKPKRPAPVHPGAIAWTILVMEHLQQLIAVVPDQGTPEDLRTALMVLLDQLEFSKQVSRPLARTHASIGVPQATLDVRGLESLRRAFAAATRSFKYAHEVVSRDRPSSGADDGSSLTLGLLKPIPLSSFIDEVERCLHSQVLSIGVGNRDGLPVLEATDVRGLRFRAMFIAGMIEGGFPLRGSGDWLYPHEERERLRRQGVALEDISSDTLLKEEHYFYQTACRATERLYLSRPLTLSDGSETVASYYIEELKRALAPAEIGIEQIRGDVDNRELPQASTAAELSVLLVRQSERRELSLHPKSRPQADLQQLLAKAHSLRYISSSALRRIEIEHHRNGLWFGPFDGEISQTQLRAMLAGHFGAEYVHSASGLSTYGNCGFRFFAARVLKLEPRNEAALDLQAIDAGKLLHEVLRRFFGRHRHQYLPLLDHEALRTEIVAVADEVFAEHERLVPPLNPRIWQIDCEIRKLILEQVLLFELRLQEKTSKRGIRPTYFELAFGRASEASDPGSSPDYLKLARPEAMLPETALIQGQIDRVDINDDQQVAIAYDYKLSQGARLNDIEAGRQVQIPIYLAALEQLFLPGYELAGGGYYRLRGRGPRLNQGLYRRLFEDCTHVTGRTMSDDPEWRRIRGEVGKRVWQFIDGIRAGDFRVRPSLGKETCKFCDYSAVCRYDTYRISRKRSPDASR